MINLTKQLYKRKNRKAVSPVISTIIIVAIAIAISIAVALYLTGITGQFTRFERLDVTSAYANQLNSSSISMVDMSLKNSGTSILSIDRVLVNGKPVNFYSRINSTMWNGKYVSINSTGPAPITMNQGETGSLSLPIKGQSGQSLELTLHTVSGKEYPKVVVLP